jgi:glycopeptide antibiotics resistance protein
MIMRIDREDHVNLKLFKMFKIYAFSNKQILGNLVMLFPLGIYIPLLYPRLSNFFTVLLISLVFSVIIESFQLVTRFRSADVDDVLLNTVGACVGYLVFFVVKKSGGFDRVDSEERVNRVDIVNNVDKVGRMS